MVKFLSLAHTYDHPWALVTTAIWQKYPNPFSPHVISADVISRSIDKNTGSLNTVRLLVKEGNPPRWGRFLLRSSIGYILEISKVNPADRRMEITTINISFSKILTAKETQIIFPHPSDPFRRTTYGSEIRISSGISLAPLRSRIEIFCLSSLESNVKRSFQGLAYVIERLRSSGHLEAPASRV